MILTLGSKFFITKQLYLERLRSDLWRLFCAFCNPLSLLFSPFFLSFVQTFLSFLLTSFPIKSNCLLKANRFSLFCAHLFCFALIHLLVILTNFAIFFFPTKLYQEKNTFCQNKTQIKLFELNSLLLSTNFFYFVSVCIKLRELCKVQKVQCLCCTF